MQPAPGDRSTDGEEVLVGRGDIYRQPDAPDPVLPDALVLDLARAHLPAGTSVSAVLQVDESGGEARAYLLDGAVVVKTQRPHRLRPRTSLAKEAALLRALAGPLAGRIPMVFGYAQVDSVAGPVELTVLSRVSGRPVMSQPVNAATRRAVLSELGVVLRAVHALDPVAINRALPVSGRVPVEADAAALRRRFELGFADLTEQLSARPGNWPLQTPPHELARRALQLLPSGWAQPPVVLHANPGPTHTFTDSAGRFTALIDFGDAYASHPALDLRSWPDPQDRRVLREGYLAGVEPGAQWDAVWTVVMVLADMAAIAAGDEYASAASTDLTAVLGVR